MSNGNRQVCSGLILRISLFRGRGKRERAMRRVVAHASRARERDEPNPEQQSYERIGKLAAGGVEKVGDLLIL